MATPPLQPITFELLVEKALHKPGFFHALRQNPGQALKAEGLAATPQIVTALRAIDYNDIQNLVMACNPTAGPVW